MFIYFAVNIYDQTAGHIASNHKKQVFNTIDCLNSRV